MAENHARITGGLGALLVAAVVAGFTHYLDNANWSRQHEIERNEYRQLQAEQAFDSVTTPMSRFAETGFSIYIYHATDSRALKDSLGKVLLRHLEAFEVALPVAEVKIKLYFSDATNKKFLQSQQLMRNAWFEADNNIHDGKPMAEAPIDGFTRLRTHLSTLATMMESELADGITAKK